MDHDMGSEEATRLVEPHNGSMETPSEAELEFGSQLQITITVEDALEVIGHGKFQFGMIIYAGLAWLADAAEMILLSFIGPAAKCEWDLSATQEGAISSVVFFGLFFGTYCWGVLSDLKGRRVSFVATAIFTVVFGLLSAWSPSFPWLLVSRSLVGFGLGGSSVVFNLCMEFLPPSQRGFWLVFLEVFWTAGSVIEALLAWLILPRMNWRLLVAASSVPFVLLLIFYPALPESPRYLLVKGDVDGALAVLRRVARVNNQGFPEGTLVLSRAAHETLPSSRVVADRTDVSKAPRNKQGVLAPIRTLFGEELRLTTVLLWLSFFANSFAYYGLVLLTTQLSNGEQQCNPTGATIQGCLPDGKPNIDSWTYKEVLITSLAEFPGLVIACLAIERIGRKATMLALLSVCAACLIPLFSPLPSIPTTVLLFGGRACIMGSFSVLWAFAPELYPTKVRSTALGFANGGGRLGGFLCPYVAVGLIEECHRALAVGLFSGVSILAAVGTLFFPVETKGLKLSDGFT